MLENSHKTPIAELGEFGLIDTLTQGITPLHAETLVGIGDDAALIAVPESENLLVSTDSMFEGVHFDLSYFPLRHLGYKAVIASISDICAMNGVPKQITVALGISAKFTVEALEELYIGMRSACEKYRIDLVGGDTCSSKQGLMITVTAIGTVQKEKQVRRAGAKPNDLVCITGDLGGAYLGYQILEREKRVFLTNPNAQPDLEGNDYILEKQLKPEARIDIIQFFKDKNILPTSMIDISDGLSSELFHLSKHSQVGFHIYEDHLPIDTTTLNTAKDFNLDPTMCMLNGGEDYELLFTLDQSHFETVKNHPDFTIIGHCVPLEQGLKLITTNNNRFDLKAQGWRAF